LSGSYRVLGRFGGGPRTGEPRSFIRFKYVV
jgi:hypothetical protein